MSCDVRHVMTALSYNHVSEKLTGSQSRLERFDRPIGATTVHSGEYVTAVSSACLTELRG